LNSESEDKTFFSKPLIDSL